MIKDSFSTYHPLVNFSYFTLVFLYTMFLMHPIALAISLMSAFAYSFYLEGRKAFRLNLGLLGIIIITSIMNPAFNHEGVTMLLYLPNGNPLTLESIAYGIAAGTMLAAVIGWFSSYNKIMTSDKFVYLFGRIIPALSLVLSMSLRFVPRFTAQIKEVSNAQKAIGRDISNGGLIERARHGLTILSIMVTWVLENAIETSDSMQSRGYGLPGRTAFSIYRFDQRDKKALLSILGLGGFVLFGYFFGALEWRYFPSMKSNGFSLYTISVLFAYLILCLMPIIINKEEERRWKVTQLKT
jgi:energy-coupling factor transport system permease protein